jgi:hypothetical protein
MQLCLPVLRATKVKMPSIPYHLLNVLVHERIAKIQKHLEEKQLENAQEQLALAQQDLEWIKREEAESQTR